MGGEAKLEAVFPALGSAMQAYRNGEELDRGGMRISGLGKALFL